jgi:hypothetical protein
MVPPAVSETIDWISYTVHHNTTVLPRMYKNSNPVTIANKITVFGTSWKDTKARFGYTVGLECVECPSLKVYMSPARPDMGVHVVLPGSALTYFGFWRALMFAMQDGISITRLDIAVDVQQYWFIKNFHDAFMAGEAETDARKGMLILGGGGATFYVGSRTSEKYLRIYDKAAESGLDLPLTRVELECKGEFARGVAKYIKANGMGNIRAIICGFCDFPNDKVWPAAMTSPTLFEGIPRPERQSNTRGWLLETVAPALAKYAAANPDFWRAWGERLLTLRPTSGVGEVDIFGGAGDFDPS